MIDAVPIRNCVWRDARVLRLDYFYIEDIEENELTRRIGERRELIKRWEGYEGDWRCATIAFDGELFILRMGDGRINSELKPFRNDVTEIGE
jgi:hypothetical protein